MVRERELRTKRDGSDYLRIVLCDRTGAVPANIWDGVGELSEICSPGKAIHVQGRYSVHPRFGPQLTVAALRAPQADEIKLEDLLDGPPRTIAQMESDFRELIETIQDPNLRELLERIFGQDCETWELFREAPAAKHYHQAYRHGLIEHCLSVAQAVSAIAATFPGINRDVAVSGALLHDIGKLDTYQWDTHAIDLTDLGKLHAEIPLGYYRIRRLIEEIPDFPRDTAVAILHIILSHHGMLEHGSPVVPCTREATLVHAIDNLGGKLGSFDRLEKTLPAGSEWSQFDRAIGGGAYFAGRTAA